jgi:zinc transport system substrate-binding protein
MRLVILAAAALAVSLSAPARAEIQVVASIVPVHSLVAGVMEGMGTPYLLVPGGASPHAFALRPSDARRLEQAKAVFWIGPSLESFLERSVRALARKAEVVALIDADGLKRLPFREGGPWEPDVHEDEKDTAHKGEHAKETDHGHDRDKEHGHAHEGFDGHVWLDPQNAIAMTRTIAQELGHADPANKARYDANAARVVARLRSLDATLAETLAPAKGKPYIVVHDGYQYLEARYGLTPAGSITVSPEVSPGAKRLAEIRSRIKKEAALCVFAEPEFEPKLVKTVIQGTDARAATLDLLGGQLAPGPEAYFELMQKLAADLTACLKGTS